MRRAAVPLLFLLLIVLFAVWQCGKDSGRLIDAQGRRVFVADGDTLKIGADTIRLAGMDAVERTQFCVDAGGKAWSCGQSALEALQARVASGGLRCTTVDHDRYGRVVARCAIGQDDLGAAMVSDGWAISDGGYDAEESAARIARRGVWAGTFESPAVWRERNRVQPRRADASN